MFRSTDSGATWASFGSSPAALPVINALAVDPTSSFPLYAGTGAGAYGVRRHQDGSLKWETNNALASRRIFAIALDPASGATLYAGTDAGLYRSVDGGLSWSAVTAGLAASAIYALLFDPHSPSILYAGTDSGFFESADGGSSWTAMNEGLTNLAVLAVAIAPTPNPDLYAGTAGTSVFRFGASSGSTQRLPIVPAHRAAHPRSVPARP
ncbi:MAG TPA: hypothetical protein VGL03_16530 [Thermoanaerobaculia bacterium]